MKKELLHNQLAYLFLAIFLFVFASIFFALWPNREYQRWWTFVLPVGYLSWGIFTHWKSGKIDKEIFLEYLASSALAFIILLLLTI